MTRAVRITKRIIDVLGGLAGLVLTLPLYPFIAAAIYIDCPGPIFYRQKRVAQLVGPGERPGQFHFTEFEMYKFRTMQVDAERHSGAVLAAPSDPRVTRVGRWLRRMRLDELPQFWQVLSGEMSLVGPRPERRELFNHFVMTIPFFEERMRNVKPGITGLAQVSLGYSGQPPQSSAITQYLDTLTNPFKLDEAQGSEADGMRLKLLYDLAYVASLEKFSSYLFMELSVLLRTPLVMVAGRGY